MAETRKRFLIAGEEKKSSPWQAADLVDPWAPLARTVAPAWIAAAAASSGRLPSAAACEALRSALERENSLAREAAASRVRAAEERCAGAQALADAAARAASLVNQTPVSHLPSSGGTLDAAVAAAAADEAASFPPRSGSARPAAPAGWTSAGLYLAGEAWAGFPPPRREGWRDTVAEGGLLLAATLPVGGGSSSGGGGIGEDEPSAVGVLAPAVARQASLALRVPAFPDRACSPPGAGGAGARAARRLAIAADFDAAAADDALAEAMRERASAAVLRAIDELAAGV